jgi:phage tail-like protein
MAPGGFAGTFNFRVTLNLDGQGGQSPPALGDGGFQECTGLDVEMDVQELQEGGRNDGTVRRVGRGKFSNIVLKRGMLFPAGGKVDNQLWRWIQDVLRGVRPVARYNGVIDVLSADRTSTVATWTFDRGLPQKVAGPQLNAKTGELAIEELTIAHEGLRLKV